MPPPVVNADRDQAILAALADGETVAALAAQHSISRARVRRIRMDARNAAQPAQPAGGYAEGYTDGYTDGYAAVWKELADTRQHRRRDCICQTCSRYRRAHGF